MSNWALELQQFNIIRVWIRGEANILADAPSRAPWSAAMARHLPIPDLPLREIIKMMFVSPEAWAKLVHERAEKMNLDRWQAIEEELQPAPAWEPLPATQPRRGNAEGEGRTVVQRPDPPNKNQH